MRHHSDRSTLSTFTAADGENLAVQDWPVAEGVPLRGTVLIVHGLGEHAGRYGHLADRLNGWGFAVRGYDHCGHGDSGGVRGGLTSPMRLVDDLADVVASTRRRTAPGTPLIVLGHSLGGLVAAALVLQERAEVDALVLSSPAFDAGLSPVQKLLVAVLPRIAPNLRVGNGVDPRHLSHDPQVVADYRADRRVHDRISARMAQFIADTGPQVVAAAPRWRVPTLLMYAGSDRVVNPDGSRAFAAAAPRHVVTTHCFGPLYHEIFNERDAAPVFECFRRWLDARPVAAPATAVPTP